MLLWHETGLSTGQVWSKLVCVCWLRGRLNGAWVEVDIEDVDGGGEERRGCCARLRMLFAY